MSILTIHNTWNFLTTSSHALHTFFTNLPWTTKLQFGTYRFTIVFLHSCCIVSPSQPSPSSLHYSVFQYLSASFLHLFNSTLHSLTHPCTHFTSFRFILLHVLLLQFISFHDTALSCLSLAFDIISSHVIAFHHFMSWLVMHFRLTYKDGYLHKHTHIARDLHLQTDRRKKGLTYIQTHTDTHHTNTLRYISHLYSLHTTYLLDKNIYHVMISGYELS